jgi:hypothetical protein
VFDSNKGEHHAQQKTNQPVPHTVAQSVSTAKHFATVEYVSTAERIWTGQHVSAVTTFRVKARPTPGNISKEQHMSEHSYLGLAFKVNLEKNPKLMDLSNLDETLAATNKRIQALHAKNDRAKANAPDKRKELNRLLNDHFNLKQWVLGCEIRVNESAGQIRNLEQRINTQIAEKERTESPLGKRNIEHAIVGLEGELAEEKNKYESLRRENQQAVRQLKAFDVSRIDGLKAELDAPKIITK